MSDARLPRPGVVEAVTPKGTVRRCDERCWFALGRRCGCVCGGSHHGRMTRPDPDVLARIEALRLKPGEHAQLRLAP